MRIKPVWWLAAFGASAALWACIILSVGLATGHIRP
jgi:hypothetical protein